MLHYFLLQHGHTALHVTALQSEPCHVPDLMAAGIDPNVKDNLGFTARDLARGQEKWLDLFSKYEPGLRAAIQSRDMEKIEYLLGCWSACHLAVVRAHSAYQIFCCLDGLLVGFSRMEKIADILQQVSHFTTSSQ